MRSLLVSLAVLTTVLPIAALARQDEGPETKVVKIKFFKAAPGSAQKPTPVAPVLGHEIHLVFTARANVRQTGPLVEADVDIDPLLHTIARYGLALRPAVTLTAPQRLGLEQLRAKAEAKTGRPAFDPSRVFILRPTGAVLASTVAAEIERNLEQHQTELERVDVVALGTQPPSFARAQTPDFAPKQEYARSPCGIGTSSDLRGKGETIHVVDYAWLGNHEDLPTSLTFYKWAVPPEVRERGWQMHGTAVLGILVAVPNQIGCTGIAPEATIRLHPLLEVVPGLRAPAPSAKRASACSCCCCAGKGTAPTVAAASAADDEASFWGVRSPLQAVLDAAIAAQEGDILLLEVQTAKLGDGAYGPAELDWAIWEATYLATSAGVVVVAAAGNGSQDLDAKEYDFYRKYAEDQQVHDSGAIIVGAGTPDCSHNRETYSTYGARVDAQAWGGNVLTLGGDASLGAFDDKASRSYTGTFGGTSAAAAIIAGVCTIAQEAARKKTGAPLSPAAMRSLLAPPSTAAVVGRIGPMPKLTELLARVQAM